ncbi:unnamed protein product [Vitrella brassicaformis CCMP3155]|uniref:Ubiquitin carboxyl-terminal hydrolase n=1 Tax=Vitrella brassicaformis (strain CCMP3155) TaxID=1169540 RepID=A0A0G4F8F1_VITBC|nr:unnamed protein product [Vitrella brassicaformis CCMP3155]|eukprot:CEM08822.1 unnamed protein product [Vitrella brassicaformis CCMP3155]
MSKDNKKSHKKWLPLEANPDVMTEYIMKLGGPPVQCVDVLTTEDWALDMVPKPVYGLILLFPIKDTTEKHREEEAARVKANGQTVSPKVYFTKQTVGNACGTVGILHTVLNIRDKQPLGAEGFFNKFLTKTMPLSPDQRAEALEEDDEIEEAHTEVEQQGQSRVPTRDAQVETHFAALIEMDGCLYELDGRKEFPINHGPSSPGTFLKDAVRVAGQFMARDPGELRFSMIAVCKAVE